MISTARLAETFPEVRYHAEWRLLTWHPKGIMTNEAADRMVQFLEEQEKYGDRPFNRFNDLSGYRRIQLELDHLVRLSRSRRRKFRGSKVKSAFYAVRLVGVSIARLYEELMSGSRLEIRTFRDRASAAEWLEVPEAILHPPPKIKATKAVKL